MQQAVGMRNKSSMHAVFLLILKRDNSLAAEEAILLELLISSSPHSVSLVLIPLSPVALACQANRLKTNKVVHGCVALIYSRKIEPPSCT
jgi:hypothetical protein